MTWLQFRYRTIAEEVCTEKELEVLKLIAAGVSVRQAARSLDISRATARDRLDNAIAKIRRHTDYDPNPQEAA